MKHADLVGLRNKSGALKLTMLIGPFDLSFAALEIDVASIMSEGSARGLFPLEGKSGLVGIDAERGFGRIIPVITRFSKVTLGKHGAKLREFAGHVVELRLGGAQPIRVVIPHDTFFGDVAVNEGAESAVADGEGILPTRGGFSQREAVFEWGSGHCRND